MKRTIHAYIAGIIDGEGTVSVYIRLKIYITPSVQVSNTNYELLVWLKSIYGGTVYHCKDNRPNRKPHYNWSVFGQKALSVIKDCYPYLRIKRQQAEILLAIKRYKPNRLKNGRWAPRLTETEFAENQYVIEQIRALNKRGQHLT